MIGYMYLYVERYSALLYEKAYELNPVSGRMFYIFRLSYHYNEQFEKLKSIMQISETTTAG